MQPIATNGVAWSDLVWFAELTNVTNRSRLSALQKWLNRSRFRLECRLGWPQGTMYQTGL